MARHNATRPTRRSQCWRWLLKLKERGINKFRLSEIPEYLKDKSMLMRASASGLVRCVGTDKTKTKTWAISSEVR